MTCTTERHVWYGSGSTSSAPLMNERCNCGALKQGDISPLEQARAENEWLREALEQIRQEVGTSTRAWHLANHALTGEQCTALTSESQT